MFNEKATEIYEANKAKGFWDEERNFGELLMLCVSELAEALEAHRKNHNAEIDVFNSIQSSYHHPAIKQEMFKSNFEKYIKNSVEDEIADTVIRLLDLCGGLGIDLDWHIEQKLRYNSMREHKHGKNY